MILVRFMGGLGNQMFQYAYAKSVSLDKGVPLKMDTTLLGEADVEDLVVRYFDLDVFGIQEKEILATKKEIERFNGKRTPAIFDRIFFKIKSLLSKDEVIIQKENKILNEYLNPSGENICLVGRWQSESFFEQNREEIKKVFSFDDFKPNQFSLDMSKKISASNSVSIQVRRGDYVTHPIYSKKIGALGVDYFRNSIEFIKDKLEKEDLVFYVISDDIEWCKTAFSSFEENIVFVEQEKSKVGYLSDLWLLTLCEHSIISNSTFSWWGAWLGETAESVIIAPIKWSISPEFTPESIVPERWSKIDNNFL
jgi:hypothetical protein